MMVEYQIRGSQEVASRLLGIYLLGPVYSSHISFENLVSFE